MGKIIALYGGGFKPPTLGHFEVVKQALNQNPDIDEFIIYVGAKERNGITQAESIIIWEIYQTYLPMKVKIEPSKSPIGDIIRFAKANTEDTIYFIIGSREDDEQDKQDYQSRTKNIKEKYPNIEIKLITTPLKNISGSKARTSIKQSPQEFYKYLPIELKDNEKEEIYNIVKPIINENSMYSNSIDIKSKIMELTQHMLDKGYNIEPLPKIEFIDGDSDNARDFLGKTAYYNPDNQTITLYTEGRHPKDIVRSFSHEMIHHIQNLEGRLNDITTTNTQEDDYLNDIEAEANLKGTMTFRNWTDSLNEKDKPHKHKYGFDDKLGKDPFGLNQFAREIVEEVLPQPEYNLDISKFNYKRTLSERLCNILNEISLSKENAVNVDGDLTGGTFKVGDVIYEYSIKNIPNPYKDLGLFYNIQFTPKEEMTSTPQMGKENYIKILSTMYKIIVDFAEKETPEYIGIASLDNNSKNYHKVYANLTDNKFNNISGYFRKDVNLEFNTSEGKGRFVVLKKKQSKLKEQELNQFGGDSSPELAPQLPINERLEYYKDYFINLSPSTFDISIEGENIIIKNLDKSYPINFDGVKDIRQISFENP